MSWLILSLAAVFIWTFVNIINKFLLEHKIKNVSFITFTSGMITLVLFTSASLILGKINFSSIIVTIAFAGGAFYSLAVWLYYAALQKEEVSRLVPMFAMNSIFVAILAFFFLSEKLFWHSYLGIILIVTSAVLISQKEHKLKIKLSIAFLLTLFATIILAFRTIALKFATIQSDIWSVLIWVGLGTGATASIIMFSSKKRISVDDKKVAKQLVFVQTFSAIAYLMFVWALAIGSATLVSTVVATRHLTVFLLATGISYLFPNIIKEKITKTILLQKLIAIVMAIVGIILIL